MMRLIDVDKVINAMQKCIDESEHEHDSIARLSFTLIIECLKQEPTVDAVEVVRCKDCRFRKSTFNGDKYYCSVWDTDDYEEAYVKDSDFCSYGERRNYK